MKAPLVKISPVAGVTITLSSTFVKMVFPSTFNLPSTTDIPDPTVIFSAEIYYTENNHNKQEERARDNQSPVQQKWGAYNRYL